jgi:hypothetical protein
MLNSRIWLPEFSDSTELGLYHVRGILFVLLGLLFSMCAAHAQKNEGQGVLAVPEPSVEAPGKGAPPRINAPAPTLDGAPPPRPEPKKKDVKKKGAKD